MSSNQIIKICFVIDTINSPTAGTEKQLILLIKKLDRKKFQPYLCVLRSSEWLKNNFNLCPVHEIGLSSLRKISTLGAIFKFAFFLRSLKADIVQAYFRDGSVVGILAARVAGVKVVIGNRRNQGFWMDWKELVIQKFLNKFTTLFIANCESTKKWAVKTEGIDPERIRVIYNGIAIGDYYRSPEKKRENFREKLGFEINAVLVAIVANLRPVKAIDVFIKAVREIVEKFPKAGFLIIGEGTERAALEKLCLDLKLNFSIRFLGQRQDVPEILSCVDIGVLSSISESFSNSIIEYMASGLAVVCTDAGGVREAVDDGSSGYIVEVGSSFDIARKTVTIIENKLCGVMGLVGRQRAMQIFSDVNIVGSYQQLYEELI